MLKEIKLKVFDQNIFEMFKVKRQAEKKNNKYIALASHL